MDEPRYKGPAYETARLKLARIRVEGQESRERASRYLARVSAESLGVARVGVWLLQGDRRKLASRCIYRAKSADFDAPRVFEVAACGRLLNLLQQRKLLVLEGSAELEALGDFYARYARELGVCSMLCAPIIRDGQAVGAITFEQTDTHERFAQKQLEFASSVADLTVIVFEQAERVELEAALQANAEIRHEVQKMQALVRLSRVVAHDINNLLGVVGAVGDALKNSSGQQNQEWALDLSSAVELGARLTEHLLTFSSEPQQVNTAVDLLPIVRDMEPLLRPLFSSTRTLVLELGPEPRLACVDPLSVQQIVLNLTRNACDAIRDPGRVVVRLRDPDPEDALRVGAIVLEVQDDGRGMDPETQVRAVEPYFTTKKGGHGLGLSIVFGIAQRYGGGVRIASSLGQGTRIAVAFPCG